MPGLLLAALETIEPWNGISFHFDRDLFAEWTSEIVPPPDQSSGEPVDWMIPSHYRFDFQGYPVPNELHQPAIFVIPVENYGIKIQSIAFFVRTRWSHCARE